jgi:hypothetical protein
MTNKLDINLQRLEPCPRIHLSWTAAGFLKEIDTVREYDYGRCVAKLAALWVRIQA